MGGPAFTGWDQNLAANYNPYAGSTVWSGRQKIPSAVKGVPQGYGPPITGFNSGLLPVTTAGEFLQTNTPIMAPGASPVQQLATSMENDGPLSIGSSVKIRHFTSPEGMLYNGLVGDIVAVRVEKRWDGLPEPMFDVRCPWRNPETVLKKSLEDKEHGDVLCSRESATFAKENRHLLGQRPVRLPTMTGFPGQPGHDTPYIIITGIPQEKIEPMEEEEQGQPMAMPMPQQNGFQYATAMGGPQQIQVPVSPVSGGWGQGTPTSYPSLSMPALGGMAMPNFGTMGGSPMAAGSPAPASNSGIYFSS